MKKFLICLGFLAMVLFFQNCDKRVDLEGLPKTSTGFSIKF